MSKITTIEQATELWLETFCYNNGDLEYKDKQGFWHLIRNGVELTKGLKAIDIYSYSNGDWQYWDKKGFYKFDKNNNKIK